MRARCPAVAAAAVCSHSRTCVAQADHFGGKAHLGYAKIRDRLALLERSRETVATNRARLLRFLSAHADVFECTPPLAGLTAVVQLRGERALLAPEFCRRLVQTFGVLLLPDAVYQAGHAGKGAATGTTAGGFCIAFGAAHFGAALEVLEGALSRLGPTLGVVDVRPEDAPQAPE